MFLFKFVKVSYLHILLLSQGPCTSPVHKPATKLKASAVKAGYLKGVDPKLAQIVMDEILEGGTPVHWDDVAGQEVRYQRSI